MNTKIVFFIAVLVGVCLLAGILIASDASSTSQNNRVLYACSCGRNASPEPGSCDCGRPMVPMHVLKREGGTAYLCNCGKDCNCRIDEKDTSKCSCGRPVKQVSVIQGSPCESCPNRTENCPGAQDQPPAGCEKCDKPCGKMISREQGVVAR